MENPFVTDWDKEKKRLLRHDYRNVSICVGVALTLIPLAYFVTSICEDKEIAVYGVFIYIVSFAAGIFAVLLYISARNFAEEWHQPATSREYEELLDLSREYPFAGAQCRAAVVELLERHGHITGWQVNWLKQDLEELGDRERVETMKEAFVQQSLENGKRLAETDC